MTYAGSENERDLGVFFPEEIAQSLFFFETNFSAELENDGFAAEDIHRESKFERVTNVDRTEYFNVR